MLLDGTFGCIGNRGNLLDAVSVEVKQRDGRAFLGRQGAQGEVEVLMLEAGIGSRAADECPRLVDAIHGVASRLVVEESVVGYLEEPRAELSFILIARQRKVSLDQGILCKIVGIVFVAAAQGEQETSQGLLLSLHMRYEDFAGHRLRLLSHTLLLSLYLLGEHLLANEIIHKKCDAHPKGNQAKAAGCKGVTRTAATYPTKPSS